MPAVSSSAIARIDYRADRKDLIVTFCESGTYAYHGVPRSLFEAFLESDSKGKFYNIFIKERFSFNRLS